MTANVDDPFQRLRNTFIVANGVSTLGTSMAMLAMSFIIYDQTHSVGATGLIAVFFYLPSIFLAGVSTRLAGRWGGLKLDCIASIAIVISSLIPVVMSILGHLTVPVLLVWQLINGVCYGIRGPAVSLITRTLAPEDQVQEYNGRLSRAGAIAGIVGCLAGGQILTHIGATVLFAFNALSTLGVVIVLAPHIKVSTGRPTERRIMDVFPLLRNNRPVRGAFISLLGATLASCAAVTFPAIAHGFSSRADALSYMQAMYAAGGIFVVASIRFTRTRATWGRVEAWCHGLFSLLLTSLALILLTPLPPKLIFATALILVFALGYFFLIANSVLSALMQIGVPEADRAAGLTAFTLVSMISIPVGQEFIGILADFTSTELALIVTAGVILVIWATGIATGRPKLLDQLDQKHQEPELVSKTTAQVPALWNHR